MNILDILKKQLDANSVEKLASIVGETPHTTQSALEKIVPAILGGIATKADTAEGASSILNLLKGTSVTGNTPANLAALLHDGTAVQEHAERGSGLLRAIFGDKLTSFVSSLSSDLNLKNNSASILTSLVTPLVIGTLGKEVAAGGFSLHNLSSYLISQSKFITSTLPTGLIASLGLGGLSNLGGSAGQLAGNVGKSVKSGYEEIQNQGKRSLGWLWPLLLALLLLAALWYFVKGCDPKGTTDSVSGAIDSTASTMQSAGESVASGVQSVGDSAASLLDSAASTVGNAADSATSAATVATGKVAESLGEFGKRALPGGAELNIPANGIENKLIAFIEDKSKAVDKTTWFSFDRLEFESGKSVLKPYSKEQLTNIAAIMKAYPTVHLKLGGYTDNTGNAAANKLLSQRRADATKQALVKLGVEANRLEAEGYGQDNPIADNATPEGRQRNRRIDVRVTKK